MNAARSKAGVGFTTAAMATLASAIAHSQEAPPDTSSGMLEEVLVMTKGGPVSSTYTGLYYAYDQGMRAFNFPRALAASLVVSVFCIAIAWLNFRFIRPRHR